MMSSLSGNVDVELVPKPDLQMKLYIKVGHYDRNLLRNAFSVALNGGRRWVTDRVEVWEEIDQRVYVRSLARALQQLVGEEGVLRRDDSGDRLDPDVSLQKNGVSASATLRFDTTRRRGRTDSSPKPSRCSPVTADKVDRPRVSV